MDDLDLDLLDLPSAADLIDPEAVAPAPHRLRTRGTRRSMRQLLQVSAAAASIDRLPDPDEAVHMVMDGSFAAWDIVPAALKLAGCDIEEMFVATLGYNCRNARELFALLDAGQVGRVGFLCSAYFRSSNTKEFAELADGLEQRGQQVAATRSHAKVIAMRFSDSRSCTTESSANLRSCRNAEQLTLHGDPAVFDFHKTWISEQLTYGRNEVK